MRRILLDEPPDSRTVCAALDRWFENHPGLRTIAVFAALPGEVDLSNFVQQHPDRRWVYPRIAGDDLVFHAVKHPAMELIQGPFGVREPFPTLPEVAIGDIDAFLCPGLAFDARGGRLGRGRGFYDRMLEGARPDALKIGVCFAHQIVEDTFPEPHDIHMDKVVSENAEC